MTSQAVCSLRYLSWTSDLQSTVAVIDNVTNSSEKAHTDNNDPHSDDVIAEGDEYIRGGPQASLDYILGNKKVVKIS